MGYAGGRSTCCGAGGADFQKRFPLYVRESLGIFLPGFQGLEQLGTVCRVGRYYNSPGIHAGEQ